MNQEKARPTNILLLGGDVRSNMGDRAIRQSMIQMIRRVKPDAHIHALSKMPERDQREFGIHVAGKNFLSFFTGFNRLRRMDLAIWGGGQLLQDDSSLAKNIYWAVILTWVRLVLRVQIVGLGIGIGPLDTRPGRFFARLAVKNLTCLVGRDPGTCKWVRSLGLTGLTVEQAPDLAVFLEPAAAEDAWNYLCGVEGISLPNGEIVVGVAVRRWFHLKRNQILPYEWMSALHMKSAHENQRFERFMDNLASALKQFGHGRAIRLLFFPMAAQEWEGDVQFSKKVAEAAGLPAHVLKLECDAAMVKALTGLCDVFVSVRMHSAILAMSMGVPSAGIVHVPKTSHFYHMLGQEESLVAMETAADPGGATAMFTLIEKTFLQRDHASSSLRTRMVELAGEELVYAKILSQFLTSKILD